MSRFPTVPAVFPEAIAPPAVDGSSPLGPVDVAGTNEVAGTVASTLPATTHPTVTDAIRHQVPEAASSLLRTITL